MTDTLTDVKLSQLTEALAVDKNLPMLGLKLEFRRSIVEMYIGINRKYDNFEGTTAMLFDWRRKTPVANQIPDLVKALVDSGFAALVDEFFPAGEPSKRTGQAARKRFRNEEGLTTTTTTLAPIAATRTVGTMAATGAASLPMHASSQAAGMSTISESDLTLDGILNMLAKHMPHSKYSLLCIHLGIGYNEAENLLVRFTYNYERATMSCLAQWKTRTGGDMAGLKTILQEIEVGALAKYIR